ncbi:MAG: ABC transporter permease [Granulosicoccus sp.]
MSKVQPVHPLAGIKPILLVIFAIVAAWHFLVLITGVPAFIFPAPWDVLITLVSKYDYFLKHALTTAIEIVAGLFLGCLLGIVSALVLLCFKSSRRWVLPLMVVSQSIPVFALAPLLTLWLGYGMSSKIAMAVLIIYFPVVAASYDGLRHTPDAMLQLARSMHASPWSIIRHIRFPAAMPSIASGIRVATSVAPIGAVIGEWVGSSRGLGFVMLNANGRMQTDEMFAALLCLSILAVTLYWIVNATLEKCLYWQDESSASL